MKRLFSLCIVCFMLIAMQAQRIAVLDFNAGSSISQADVDGISAIFNTYFSPSGYTLVERTRIDRIIDEQGFQRGRFTQDQMVRIGQLLNVSRVVVGDINYAFKQYNVDVRVVNVESGTIAAKSGTTWDEGASYRQMMKELAEDLAQKIAIIPQPVEPIPAYVKIERISNNEYKMGDRWMTKKEYYNFINNRDLCVPSYVQFQQGLKLEKAGKWTTVAGAGTLLLGGLILAIGIPVNVHYDDYSTGTEIIDEAKRDRYYGCEVTGFTFFCIGGVTALCGVTMWSVGIVKKNKAYEKYNDHCAKPVTLDLKYTGNGLGLAFKF